MAARVLWAGTSLRATWLLDCRLPCGQPGTGHALPAYTKSVASPEVVATWGQQARFFAARHSEILAWQAAGVVFRCTPCTGGTTFTSVGSPEHAADGRLCLLHEPELDVFLAFMRANGLELDGLAAEQTELCAVVARTGVRQPDSEGGFPCM